MKLDTIVVLDPQAAEERGVRAALRFQNGDRQGALEDVDWLLDHRPAGLDVERIQELLGGANLEDPEMRLNVQLAPKIRAALGGSAP